MNEWRGKISAEIDKSCPHSGLQSVEPLEHRFFNCPLVQQGWRYVANIVWQFFAKRGNLGPHKSFLMVQCLFDKPLHKALIQFNLASSSWGMIFRGLFGTNGMIWFLILFNGPLRKHIKLFGTPCRIMIELSGNKLSRTWKCTDVAYQDVLNEFDAICDPD